MFPWFPGITVSLYSLLGTASQITAHLFNLLNYKKKKQLLSRRAQNLQKHFSQNRILSSSNFWAVVETLLISCVQYLPIGVLNTWFGNLVGTGANYFGIMSGAPIALIILFILLWVNPLKQFDLITPAYPLALTVSKIACFCAGCCSGIQTSSGMYNFSTGQTEFPVQLVEAALAFCIFLVLIRIRKKAKTGTLFPIYLVLYSGTRFFSEFLRSEENVLWIFKTYHLLCLCGVAVGSVLLLFVLKYGDMISDIFAKKEPQ